MLAYFDSRYFGRGVRLLRLGWRGAKFLALLAALALFGLLVGLMVVLLPPMAWIGTVGMCGVVLLWVMPDIELIPDTLGRRLFFTALGAQLVLPLYYAFFVPGLPLLSVRRLLWFAMLICVGLMVSGSQVVRQRIATALRMSPLLSFMTIGFMIWAFISVITSKSSVDSMRDFSEALLYWFGAFFACLAVLRRDERGEQDLRNLYLLLALIGLFAGAASGIERILQRHFFSELWPAGMLQAAFANSPALLEAITKAIFRYGEFRSNYIYATSLSAGEMMAMIAPLCIGLLTHGRSPVQRALGAVGAILCLVGVVATGSRGSLLGFCIGMSLYVLAWSYRRMRQKPNSLVGFVVLGILACVACFIIALIFAWPRFGVYFTGGSESVNSTDARFQQWEMATPWIWANPITGHGQGLGALVVGFYYGTDVPTLDSYIISLLVEVGIPGFLFFFGSAILTILLLGRMYLTDLSDKAELAAPLACSIIVFIFQRLALSQRENHFLFYAILAMSIYLISMARTRTKGSAAPLRRAEQALPQQLPDRTSSP